MMNRRTTQVSANARVLLLGLGLLGLCEQFRTGSAVCSDPGARSGPRV